MTHLRTLERALGKLCSPETHTPLKLEDGCLATIDGRCRFKLSKAGIPIFADSDIGPDAARQRAHYDLTFAQQYAVNLEYPHTQEYMAYLDRVFVAELLSADLSAVVELCCGQGELLQLQGISVISGVGVDISTPMLEMAVIKHSSTESFVFVQGDATKLPLNSAQFSIVVMLGGIHHVRDRERLFAEVYRILKPGGRFYFREPVSDFPLWRWIRSIVYRLSPALDADTERPLLWEETVPVLERAGLRLYSWRTYGFIGFCLFMNSDVLIFNRLFRFVPGIRTITKSWAYIDDVTLKIPGFRRFGLQVVGVAEKPAWRD